ncbi:hypothetical protein GALMADRAFT_138434 [Galerina marginata CBS 339.88]|uniref:Protein PBN1 n=1 Tax=Galerina marginata (strain CBS 339.88) TaxID=685588 RepID=A0A067T7I8_GALM3|nr:hypothetical protein GALMADRAFT_138434 [Galerina marginata CBS 339.88]
MAYLVSKLGPQSGFHPVSTSTIHLSPQSTFATYESCSLHLYYTLPPLLFVDTHELAQRNASYTFRHWGNRDLEKPVHALPDEISELLIDATVKLLELDGPGGGDDEVQDSGRAIHVEVPMHLRYGAPKATSALGEGENQALYEELHVDWPKAFLWCPSSSHSKQNAQSLPEHIFSALPNSVSDNAIIPIPPHANFSSETSTITTLLLPIGNAKDLEVVEPLTALTILVCFLWLLQVSWRTATRLNANVGRPKTE